MAKVRNFKYEDQLIREPDIEVAPGKFSPSITAKNYHPGRGFKIGEDKYIACPIEYDTSTGKCLIYSDKEIPGLTLVGTDEEKQKNKVTLAEVMAMPVTLSEVG